MNRIKKYNFSLTGASAMITETLIIAKEYENLKDWKLVEQTIKENNLLMKIKESTFKREFVEIKKRLSTLNQYQLSLLINGDLDETKAMIFLSLAKTYAFFFKRVASLFASFSALSKLSCLQAGVAHPSTNTM